MHCVLVSHFHWDREWYRPFEAYRARLVDAVDRVLDLLAADAGYHFLLDGQTVLLEDYLQIRPGRRAELERGLREGRLAAGPWYVQPDSLLPSGESHVRNLLYGRRVGEAFGPVSRIGYVPDSFGHPAQLPQILAGFGISTFVHWRGSGSEIDALGSIYTWDAPDGSTVEATLLRDGYFNAASLPADAEEAARALAGLIASLGDDHLGPALLMNGFDHMLPDAHTAAVAEALVRVTGFTVRRGLLEHALGGERPGPLGRFCGELLGARIAPLLPGVWSTRMPLKLANRRCEAALEGWAEPWAALARCLGTPDEQPALRAAWRSLLHNQAHDSICGCSLDAVATAVKSRFDEVEGLAAQTIARLLERIAGLGTERCIPWTLEQEIVVFNPTPQPRTDVVRVALDAYPAMRLSLGRPAFPPLLLASFDTPAFLVDGQPAAVVAAEDPNRPRWLPGQQPLEIEFVAADVPPFGCRRFALTTGARQEDETDDGRVIENDELRVALEPDGTLGVRFPGAEYQGLLGLEDRGDRGDTYDFDGLDDDPGARLESMTWQRRRHPSGVERLEIRRVLRVPVGLDDTRRHRAQESALLNVWVEARVAPGVPRLDLTVRVDNTARDHRLRVCFPTGRPLTRWQAATTFDVALRSTVGPDDSDWMHRAPPTFAHQGWVSANGLMVVAPGLPEAEVTVDGMIAITLLRAVGWLARYDLRSRPQPAGPPMEVPGAQMLGMLEARLSVLTGSDPGAARAAELGLRAVIGGPAPLLPDGASMLALAPSTLVLSALKPDEHGDGIVLRVLNPTDSPQRARIRLGFAVAAAQAVRLDEAPADQAVEFDGDEVAFTVPPHALRSVRLQ
jgi:alpha-mannosidase